VPVATTAQPSTHKVVPGDCTVSVCAKAGLDPAIVFKLSENTKLRDHDHDAQEVLAPGDLLHLPARALRQENRATGSYHPFKVKTIPARLKVRFLDNGEPRADLPCIVQIDGIKSNAKTDSDGLLDHTIPPAATEVRVRVGPSDALEDYVFKLGHLDPLDTVAGLQARLTNLGFTPGPIDNLMGPLTQAAIKAFQQARKIEVTGKPDHATLAELKSAYGC